MDDKRYHLKLDYRKKNNHISYIWLSDRRMNNIIWHLYEYRDQIVKVEIKEAKQNKEKK
jgi:hypothetical protein